MAIKDYYKILEIREDASKEIIKMAHKTLSKKYHPDFNKGDELYSKRMKDINEAKETLIDDSLRKDYDVKLKKEKERFALSPNMYYNNPQSINASTSSKTNVKIYLIAGSIVLILISIVVFLSIDFKKNIDIGITKSKAISSFGEPDKVANGNLVYGKSTILIQSDVVVGWIDTYNDLNLSKCTKNCPTEKDIFQGMLASNIIKNHGPPDSYSDKIIAYKNLIIYLSQGVVSKVETIK